MRNRKDIMKKILTFLFVFILALSAFPADRARAVEPEQIRSQTALLMDLETGQVLYDKGMHQRVYPASTTKILTALLAVEHANPHAIMTVTESAIGDLPWYGSHVALAVGEQISVADAIYAIMLPSANDASNVLAEHVAGSLEAFNVMMNERAREIGALSSNFTNAHGLHDDNHFTTAYDMALITRYAMNNEDFRRYFGAARHTMAPTNINGERSWVNQQYMLVPGVDAYDPDVIGGKVGFTNAARHTMSTVATRGGRSLICVVMDAPTRWDRFNDTSTLLSFGFEEFIPFTVSSGDFSGYELPVMQEGDVIGRALFDASQDFTALLHTSADISNLRIQPHRPDFYDYFAPTPFIVNFDLPTAHPHLPSFLGSVQIEPLLEISSMPAMLYLSGDSKPLPFWLRALRMAGIVLGGLVLLFALFVLHRRRVIKKRRRLRMERLARKRAEAEQFPPVPSPANLISRRIEVSGTVGSVSSATYLSSSFPRSNGGYGRWKAR